MATASTPRIDRLTLVDTLSAYVWAGVPAVLIGHPGSTKSATCRAIFSAFKWPFERVGIPSITDPILLSGLPSQDGETTTMKPYPWLRNAILNNQKNQRNGLIFDDAAEAPRTVQTALLDVLGEKVVQEHHLPLTSMIATANPIGGGLQVTPAMANRIAHLNWTITPKEHAQLMCGDYPLPEIPAFEDKWEERIPAVRRIVAGFLDTLQDFGAPDLDGPTVSLTVGAYPTARTWELAVRSVAAVESSTLDPTRMQNASRLAVRSLVGDVAANAYFTYLAYPDMLKPSEVVSNPRLVIGKPELFKLDRPDRAYIFLSALTKYVIKANDVKSWKAGWEVLGHFAAKEMVPVCAIFALFLHRRRPDGAPATLPEMKHFEHITSPAKA